MGLIYDDVYRILVTRLEILRHVGLRMVREKSVIGDEKDKVRAFLSCGLTEREIALKK